MHSVFPNIGSVLSFLLGLMAIFRPSKVENFVSIKSMGKEGVAEIRATYGGFFAGLSLYAMLVQIPEVFIALGFGWLGAAMIRFVTLLWEVTTWKNLAGVVLESVIGILCISVLFKF